MSARDVPPQSVLTHKGVRVYRTYKKNDFDHPWTFWFALDDTERPTVVSKDGLSGEGQFDIRHLPEAADLPSWNIREEEVVTVLRAAIDAGHLTAEGVQAP